MYFIPQFLVPRVRGAVKSRSGQYIKFLTTQKVVFRFLTIPFGIYKNRHFSDTGEALWDKM